MGEVVGALYGHHYYNKSENKNLFLELFKDLRESFFNTLNNTDWIDLETKQKAWRKASFMQVYFGYPFLYNNETKLSDVYCRFSLKDGEFYENIRSLISEFNKPELASFGILLAEAKIFWLGAYCK
ncbi:Neprilysin [Orchesella cincta]|uniref:Neprilysin n=1 Tax=Orchesella cincta TaxID=48709 RepID=A0A1D2MPQ7_ORCCI|nr:Neprilysin [Orchesella cincta]